MASDDSGEKSELPTDKRRMDAREKGNIVRSSDLNAAAILLGAASALALLGTPLCNQLARLMVTGLSGPVSLTYGPSELYFSAWSLVGALAVITLPVLALLAGTSLVVTISQAGFLLTPDSILPKWNRLSPIQGFGRIFSSESAARLAGSLLKLAILGFVTYLFIASKLPGFLKVSQAEIPQIAVVASQSLIELGFWLAGCLIVLAVADYGYHFWKHEQDLMMSKQEIRDEMKEMDGDPSIRMRRREAHRKLVQAREMHAVKTADVVVTNPTEIAVALKYDPTTMPAPTVVAKGMGELAAQIRKIAAANGVPIVERKPVARFLYQNVKVGRQIPPDMYAVFAEILAYVYRITGKKPRGSKSA